MRHQHEEEKRVKKMKRLLDKLDSKINLFNAERVIAGTAESFKNHPVMIALRNRN